MTNYSSPTANRVNNDHNQSDRDAQIGGIRRGPLPKKNYMVIPNSIVHAEMTFTALGILTFFLEKPPDWVISSPEAMSRLKGREGRAAIRAGFRELQKAGYMVERKYRDSNGRFVVEWVIYDHPVDNYLSTSKQESPGHTDDRRPEAVGGKRSSYISTNKLNTHLEPNLNLVVDNSNYQNKCKNCAGGWLIDAEGYEVQPLTRCGCDYTIPKAGRSLPPEESWEARKSKNTGQSGQSKSYNQ